MPSRILLGTDETRSTRMRQTLERLGFEVTEASTHAELLEKAVSAPPTVLFMDRPAADDLLARRFMEYLAKINKDSRPKIVILHTHPDGNSWPVWPGVNVLPDTYLHRNHPDFELVEFVRVYAKRWGLVRSEPAQPHKRDKKEEVF